MLSVAVSILSKRNGADMGTDQAEEVCPCLILCECIAASISVASRVCALECSGDKGSGYHCHSQEPHTRPFADLPSPSTLYFPRLRRFCKDFQCWGVEKGLGRVSSMKWMYVFV